jgi:hypothetical protein
MASVKAAMAEGRPWPAICLATSAPAYADVSDSRGFRKNGMSVLVLGGTGFIGGPVVARLLADGVETAVAHHGARPVAAGARSVVLDRGDRRRWWRPCASWAPTR